MIFSYVCIFLCGCSSAAFFIYIARTSKCVNEWMGLGRCTCYLLSSLGLFRSGFYLFYSNEFNFLLLLYISLLSITPCLFSSEKQKRGGSGERRVWEKLERVKKTWKQWSGYSTWEKYHIYSKRKQTSKQNELLQTTMWMLGVESGSSLKIKFSELLGTRCLLNIGTHSRCYT